MFRLLNRIILIALVVALLAAVYATHANMTQINFGHDTLYAFKWTWLHQVREVCIFGILAWSLFFLRGEPLFARIGLAAVIIALAVMNLPPHLIKELPVPPGWH